MQVRYRNDPVVRDRRRFGLRGEDVDTFVVQAAGEPLRERADVVASDVRDEQDRPLRRHVNSYRQLHGP